MSEQIKTPGRSDWPLAGRGRRSRMAEPDFISRSSSMSVFSRRELLKRLLGCAATAASMVVAETVLPEKTEASATPNPSVDDPEGRADQLAEELPAPPEGTE